MAASGNQIGAWTNLEPPKFPEGDYVAVWCKCGAKNRSDQGWRYRVNPFYARDRLRTLMMFRDPEMVAGACQLEYECENCRGDKAELAELNKKKKPFKFVNVNASTLAKKKKTPTAAKAPNQKSTA